MQMTMMHQQHHYLCNPLQRLTVHEIVLRKTIHIMDGLAKKTIDCYKLGIAPPEGLSETELKANLIARRNRESTVRI